MDSIGKSSILKSPGLWVKVFFALYLLMGILHHRDYGIFYDEKAQRGIGAISAKYILSIAKPGYLKAHPELDHLQNLHEYQDKDYGVFFELPLIIIEKALGLQEDTQELFYMRHLCTFLFFYIGVFFFYKLCRNRFQSEWWGLAGAAALALTPRFFAEAFYNTKDAVFLASFVMGMYFLNQFLEKRTLKSAFIFGFFAAASTDIRILGVFLPLAASCVFFWELIFIKNNERIVSRELKAYAGFVISFAIFTVIMFPYLWENPVGNFIQVFKNMSHFRWSGMVFYRGELIDATQLPVMYVPVWIAITTPLLWLILFPIGMLGTLYKVVKNKIALFSNANERADWVALGLFLVPVLSVILTHAIIYNGWRHLYFTYGPFLFLSLVGLKKISDYLHRKEISFAKYVAPGLISIQLLFCATYIYRAHPHEGVYFNFLAGAHPETRFEADYLGLAYRKGLEYVAKNDKRDSITVMVQAYPGKVNWCMLSPENKKRIHIIFNPSVGAKKIHSSHKNIIPDYWVGADTKGIPGRHIHKIEAVGMNILEVIQQRPYNPEKKK